MTHYDFSMSIAMCMDVQLIRLNMIITFHLIPTDFWRYSSYDRARELLSATLNRLERWDSNLELSVNAKRHAAKTLFGCLNMMPI